MDHSVAEGDANEKKSRSPRRLQLYALELSRNWCAPHGEGHDWRHWMRDLERLAELIRQRNVIEVEITKITCRPALLGPIGEYVAARIFQIELGTSANQKGVDGRFQEGALRGSTVNIKWYAKREGVLDLVTSEPLPDYYLVLTGPEGAAMSSRGQTRPWRVTSVYLFNARDLAEAQRARGVAIGISSSVPQHFWEAAEIYPRAQNSALALSEDQRRLLGLFA